MSSDGNPHVIQGWMTPDTSTGRLRVYYAMCGQTWDALETVAESILELADYSTDDCRTFFRITIERIEEGE